MLFDQSILNDQNEGWLSPPSLGACYNAHGLYNSLSYVVRLSPHIHEVLAARERREGEAIAKSWEEIQATSTYFHETIHWWQHIGSTAGFMMSLSLPAQAHINEQFLKGILSQLGPIKPLRRFDISNSSVQPLAPEFQMNINFAMNNWHDIEYAKCIMIQPKFVEHLVADPYFQSIGHSYNIMWASVLRVIAATQDPTCAFLPNPSTWEDGFRRARESKSEYFYTGDVVRLAAIGAREIFEGQARFSQIQFLHSASSGKFDLPAARESGMFGVVYVSAFEAFLKGLKEPWPTSPLDPLVNLFLLLCDLAINPGDGFPFDVIDPESFFESVDPGLRFTMLCWMVRDKHPELKQSIVQCSKDEFLHASELLSKAIVCPSPRQIWEKVNGWSKNEASCVRLLHDATAMKFDAVNMPIKLFFSEFLRFQKSKSKHPEYFCWPGFWSVGEVGKAADFAKDLFANHEPLFVDAADGEVRPRLHQSIPQENVQEMFNAFYQWNASYLLSRQWMVSDGDFDLDFEWLTTREPVSVRQTWAKNILLDTYGFAPEDFRVLKPSAD
ncbi:hypothetical protein [Janthinobacterium sp. MDT1-19]|uniref:hypothetical protein n=1 Tax=Janthinobacterium sp. MDT1-19 TaxID=1259339 RepID=UPI003F225E01